MLEKYHSYRNKWQGAWGRKDASVAERQLALLEIHILGHVKVSYRQHSEVLTFAKGH